MVDVGAAFPADREAAVLMQQGKGLFDYPPPGDFVAGAAARDVAGDPSSAQLVVDARVVVALVRDQGGDPSARPAGASAQGSDLVGQLGQQQVVARVGARQCDRER